MNHSLTTCLFIIMMCTTPLIWAAEADKGTGATDAPTTNEQSRADDKQKSGGPNKSDKGTVGDIFRPTEEISEDFAVSFPVDI